VQGVGYRATMVDEALAAGASGWVRNRRDGSVEAFVQGTPAAVDAVVRWARRGPAAARVTELEQHDAPPLAALAGFEARATA
jgi:acylphosphatase